MAPTASISARSSASFLRSAAAVAYAVLSFGGFLGIGDDYYPLPWEKLHYDEELDGYRIDLTKEQIENAPHFANLDDDELLNARDRKVYDYYGVAPYWM